MAIRIITPKPGPTTSERILELIDRHPQGMTITDLEQHLNRPKSMLQICLKVLIADKLIKKRKSGMQLIYYPVQQ
ncbi:MAG: helix-turn-helix domain-containing protein [Cyanobacteriota bacterium]|nr:helix-turn-helix domain-containing protein [Cyanobacteriota bacterium]